MEAVAIIEAAAIIGLLGWAAWFVWHTKRRDAEPDDLFPPEFVQTWQEAGRMFGRTFIEGLASPIGAERARYVVYLMMLLDVDEEMARDILGTAAGLARETVARPQWYWQEAYRAAAMGKFE